MRNTFKVFLLIAMIGLAFGTGCLLSSLKQIPAESFRRQFEISESARSATFIGVTQARAYAERTELIGLRPLLGFEPDLEVVWTPLSEFTVEEQKSLAAGKVPWSPFLTRVREFER